MFNIVCVTHRKLCKNFFKRVGELYENNVPVILREKDLSESEYEELAKKVIEICPNVILHAVSSVDIDVYGIGGISPENIGKIQNTGAKGGCIMSGFMKCDNVKKYLDETYKNLLKK